MHRKKIARLGVVDLPVEREKISAFADRPDDVGNGRPPGWMHRFDPMKGVVMRGPQEIRHAGVGDDEFLAAAPLSVENTREKHAGVAHQKSSGLEQDLESRAADERANHLAELGDIHRTLGRIVGDGQPAADVQVFQRNLGLPLDFPAQMEQALQADLVRRELRDLGAHMHVEPQQPEIGERDGDLSDGERFVERNPEFHSLLASAGVGMRGIDEHFRIHAQCNRGRRPEPLCDGVEDVQLLLRFDVDEENLGAQRLFHLALRLANAAEDDVLAGVARLERAEKLATGDDVEPGTELAQKCQDGDARVRLHAVVKPRVEVAQRRPKLSVLGPDHRRAVDVGRSSNLASDVVERDLLHISGGRFAADSLIHRASIPLASLSIVPRHLLRA